MIRRDDIVKVSTYCHITKICAGLQYYGGSCREMPVSNRQLGETILEYSEQQCEEERYNRLYIS